MQLILATDYAIRSILYLALVGRMATASEVSEKMKIPKQYLVTTSRKLKEAGLIAAAPGVRGGYFLARPPEEITLLDVIQVTEGTIRINRCLEHDKFCSRFATEDCAVRQVYEDLQLSVEDMLSNVTMADLKHRMEKGKKEANGGVSHD